MRKVFLPSFLVMGLLLLPSCSGNSGENSTQAKCADLSNSKVAGKFDGYSEAWSKSTFPVKSIKELMRLTEEFEDE